MSNKHDIIKLRRGTAAEWAASEPQPGGEVLKLGEPGYEKDTKKLKIGDGITPWNSLPYIGGGGGDIIINPEDIQDIVGNGFLVSGSGINISYNDNLNSLAISTSGVSFVGHTHVSSNITDFTESVQDVVGASGFLVSGTGINISYNDGTNSLTIETDPVLEIVYPVRALHFGGTLAFDVFTYNVSPTYYWNGDFGDMRILNTIEYPYTSCAIDVSQSVTKYINDFPGRTLNYASLEVLLVDAADRIVGWGTTSTANVSGTTNGTGGTNMTISVLSFPTGIPNTWVLGGLEVGLLSNQFNPVSAYQKIKPIFIGGSSIDEANNYEITSRIRSYSEINPTATQISTNTPYGLAINNSTNKLYVVSVQNNIVYVIDRISKTITNNINVDTNPYFIALNTVTNRAYVSNYNSNSISVIDTNTDTVVNTISVSGGPLGVAVNSNTNQIYVTSKNSGILSIINGATNTITNTITVGSQPEGVCINNANNKIYVCNSNSNTISIIDASSYGISTLSGFSKPFSVACNNITNKVYVTNFDSNTISVIDGITNTITSTISTGSGSNPYAITIDERRNLIYSTNYTTNTIHVINGSNNTIIDTVSVGAKPASIDVNETINQIYISCSDYFVNKTYVIDRGSLSSIILETSSATGILDNYAVFDSNGNFGIGTNNPQYDLDVVGSGNFSNNLYVNGELVVGNLKLSNNTISSSSGNIIISPSGNGALQRDGGGGPRGAYAVDWQLIRTSGNMVASGAGSVIGGGSDNTSSSPRSTVGGGMNNTSSGWYSTVSGGKNNIASGQIGAQYGRSTVGGGSNNTASGNYSVVGGGAQNSASKTYSAITGGKNNTASGQYSVINGGRDNVATNWFNTVGGGNNNTASGTDPTLNFCGRSTVGGGDINSATGDFSTIGGGTTNTASGGGSTIGGGGFNTAAGNNATISGGCRNTASGYYSTVGAGSFNTASGYFSVVGGGFSNTSSGLYSSTVGGGYSNTSSGNWSTVSGGRNNTSSGIYSSTVGGGLNNTSSANSSTVGGGGNNTSSGNYSTISGGRYNTSSGFYSTVVGGWLATADRYGMRAYAAGSFNSTTPGTAQSVNFVLRRTTSDATPATLFLDGDSTLLTIPSGKALFATVTVAGIINGGSKAAHYIRKVAIKNVGGTTSLIGTVSTLGTDIEDDASYDISITADNTNDALQINVTGKTNENIRWVAHVEGVEIAYG